MIQITKFTSLVLVSLLLNVTVTSISAQQVFINEFLASNSNVNADEFGEYDDWVELYNASSSSVNLSGMFFTDDLTNTAKWSFPPGTSIPANGFLLLWCDNQNSQGPLHTSFKLSSGGEDLALVASDGTTIIDSYTYGPQTANVSQGRQTDGSTPWVFFASPTPAESNAGNNSTVAVMPVASQNGGHYNNSITISLSTTTPGATIRYTLDGSEPTSASSIYNNPLTVNATTVLRARTFKSGMEESRIMTHTYLYGIDHTMPIFCISTDDDNFFGAEDGIYTNWDDDIEKPAHVELYEADGSFGFRQDLGVQVHGGFSQSYPHKGLAFIAKNEYGNNKINYPLFPDLPFTEYGSFILRASGNDWSKTLFRDALASNLVNKIADVDTMIKDPNLEFQAYRPAIVYLNGAYFGIHNLREKLDWRYLKTHYGIEKEEADIVQRENTLEHGNLDAWQEYRDFIEDADFTDPADYAELETWINLNHYIDYFLHNIYLDNNDWPDNNNKTWRLRQTGAKWRYFLYDMDRAFGLIPLSGDYNSGDWTSASLEMVMAETQTESHNAEWSTLLLRKLMLNDGFRQKFINRMADNLNILYTPSRVLSRIDEFEEVYTPEINQHADKWWDTNYYATNVNRARLFAENRTDEMWNQFEDFYTDITDVVDLEMNASPAAGGTIHLNTINLGENNFPWTGLYFEGVDVPLYATPKPGYVFTGWSPSNLGNNAITTMNLDGDEEITANFALGSTQIGNVVINEINYHSPDTCDAGDWLELYNAGSTGVNISGWFLEDESGNYFSIPANTILPGQGYLVLVEDEIRFQNVHPTVTNFIGGFGNSLTGNMGLSNGGEWISINNANRSFKDTVRYDDKLPWPVEPDGQGPSLQLISYTLDNALPSSWVASQEPKGTPGAPNQGTLYLGENIVLCSPENLTLDATYSPCFGCTYSWNTGATSASITVSPTAGQNNYAVTVTDGGGITQADEVIVELSNPFTLSHTQQNLACYEDDNASINLSVNAAGTYQYLWTNGATTQDINNLTVGTYTVTVSDALFCTMTETIEITAPPALSLTDTETEINCFGDLAAIDISVSGGAFPYNYQWSNGATTPDINNLPEGTYTLTVTDMNNCTKVKDFNFEEPTEITGDFDIEYLCDGTPNADIDADISGGTGSYFYSWSTGFTSTSDDLFNVGAGIYTLTVTDDNGCTWTDDAEILTSTIMTATANITNTSCTGTNDGSINLAMTGGISPYEYAWNTGTSNSLLQNLAVGNYLVTVTDSVGCQYYNNFTIATTDPVTATADIDEITCFGLADAAIQVEADGGNGSYTFAWSNGSNSNVINNLSDGNYTLTITDGLACSSVFSYPIEAPAPFSVTTQTTGIDCNGNASGSVSVTISGGAGNYTYLWNNNATTSSISNLTTGNYTVTITDANSCSITQSATVTQNAAISNTLSQNNLLCNNTNTGSITISTAGGESPYSYSWSNGATTANLTNLAAATYTVTISDNNNCTSVESITITEPTAMATTFINQNINCNGNNSGSLSANPTGGIAPYSFQWNNGASSANIDNLSAGSYTVTITDNNNCTLVQSAEIIQPQPIESNAIVGNITCNGLNNGYASVDPEGGIGALAVLWSTGANTMNISDLAADDYAVTITDLVGCTSISTFEITEPAALVSSYQSTPISCHDGSNGSITLNPTGGNGGFVFEWNNGSDNETLQNINAGTYQATITDAMGCSIQESITLTNPTAVSTMADVNSVSCFSGDNGSVELNTSGGNSPYSYNWNNGSNNNTINNLSADNYTVTISDNNDCTLVQSYSISSPSQLVANPQITAADCSGDANATIVLSPSGGTGDYTFLWNTGATSEDLAGLAEGNYVVTITDNNNCSTVENILVDGASPLAIAATYNSPSCFGGNNGFIYLYINGGEGPYDFAWSTGQTEAQIENLAAGDYTVTISDNNACTSVENFTISEPAALNYNNFQLINNNCQGSTSGVISLSATGGMGNYTYTWNTGSQENTINSLAAGTYTVTITDNANCTFSESFTITEPDALEVNATNSDVTCYGESNGAVTLNTEGGTGTYSYFWNNGETTASLSNLPQGSYSVTISDELACSVVETIVINEPATLETNALIDMISCHGDSNGSINLNTSGGTSPFEYEWNNGETNSTLSSLSAGDYAVTITDVNGCSLTESFVVTEPTPLIGSYGVMDVDCHGDSMGLILAAISGGTLPHSFAWSNGETVSTITQLPAGDYGLTVTDDNGCQLTEAFEVNENTLLESEAITQSISCSGAEDGQIELDISGGISPYEILWSNGVLGNSINGLLPGTYTASITDAVGCLIAVSETIADVSDLEVSVQNTDPGSGMDGSISVTVTGGTPTYSITWNTGATDFELNNLAAGVYSYMVTDANGCTIGGSVTLTTVGLNQLAKSALQVFPNPTTGMVYVESDFNITAVFVFDVLGRTLLENAMPEGTYTSEVALDLSRFESGVYLLRVQTVAGERVERVVVEGR